MRQSPHETIKDRVIQIRRHNARPTCGDSNLLLVMPAFRQFASSIKPVQGCFFSCPANSESGRSKRVQRFVKTGTLLTGRLHHVDQDRWAKTAVDGHAFRVETIHQSDYILSRTNINGFHITRVSNHRKFAKYRIEQMGSDVANLPQWCDGLQIPFAQFERTQQLYQFFVHSAQQVSTEDGGGTEGLAIHVNSLS